MSRAKQGLNGLTVYNPEFLSKEELVQTFIARKDMLDELVRSIRVASDNAPQHHILLGQRGMGKSTLLRRLRYALEDDSELSAQWTPLNFPEEQYNIATLSDFWVNCLDVLAEHLDAIESPDLEALDRDIAQLQPISDETRRQEDALGLLIRMAAKLETRLILLIDNIDLIFDRLGKEEWVLRKTLSSEPRLLLIGASAVALETTYKHGEAFYEFFHQHRLDPLSEEMTFEMMRVLAEVTSQPKVAKLVAARSGRISTIRLLAGGNPRTLTLLFNLLAQGSAGTVRSDLERLLDQVTPLYKHRFEELSPQNRRVMDALAQAWRPVTANEVAEATRLNVNQASAQLNRLVKDGTVEKVALPNTKRLGFQVAERFFNIWYLMRTSRRIRKKLTVLVEFLRLMYEPAELESRSLRHLRVDAARSPLRHAELSLAYAQVVQDPAIRGALELRGLQGFCTPGSTRNSFGKHFDFEGTDAELKTKAERVGLLREAKNAIHAWERPELDWNPDEFWELLGSSLTLPIRTKHAIATSAFDGSEVEEAFANLLQERGTWPWNSINADEAMAFRQAIREGDFDPTELTLSDLETSGVHRNAPHIVPLGLVWATYTGQIEPSLALIKRHINRSCSVFVQLPFSIALRIAGHPNEADSVLDGCLDANPNSKYLWHQKGSVLLEKPDSADDAISAFRRCVELDPEFALAWGDLGAALLRGGRQRDEAEAACKEAIRLNPDLSRAWCNLSFSLLLRPNSAENAEAAARRAIDLEPDLAMAWTSLGAALTEQAIDDEEAERAFRRAIELDPNLGNPWHGLAILLRRNSSRFEEAQAAFRRGFDAGLESSVLWNEFGELLMEHFGCYEEAETAFLTAIDLDSKHIRPRLNLAELLTDRLNRPDEAEDHYRKLVELNPGIALYWFFLGIFLFSHKDEWGEAELSYRRAIELDSLNHIYWSVLAGLLSIQKGRGKEEEVARRKAVGLAPDEAEYARDLAQFLFEHEGDLGEATELGLRALELEPDDPATKLLLARIWVNRAVWPEVSSFLAATLGEDPAVLDEQWDDVLELFEEIASGGFAAEALPILIDAGKGERWEPLVEALEVVAAGSRDRLLALPVEVRQATDLVLERIAPDYLPIKY